MTKEAVKALPRPITQILPKGSLKEISDKVGLDRNSVRMVLHGVWSNERVIQAALEILERHRAEVDDTIQELRN